MKIEQSKLSSEDREFRDHLHMVYRDSPDDERQDAINCLMDVDEWFGVACLLELEQ